VPDALRQAGLVDQVLPLDTLAARLADLVS
jgi:hypothetical protein